MPDLYVHKSSHNFRTFSLFTDLYEPPCPWKPPSPEDRASRVPFQRLDANVQELRTRYIIGIPVDVSLLDQRASSSCSSSTRRCMQSIKRSDYYNLFLWQFFLSQKVLTFVFKLCSFLVLGVLLALVRSAKKFQMACSSKFQKTRPSKMDYMSNREHDILFFCETAGTLTILNLNV